MKSLRLLLIIMILIIVPSTALADIDIKKDYISIYMPQLNWKLKIPASDWELQQEKRKPSGHGFYYYLSSKSSHLNFSVYLEKTTKCGSPDECRDHFWSNPGPNYKNPLDVEKKTINGFSIIQFYLDKPMGYPVIQSNISAHSYKDGAWIDIHLSKVSTDSPDYSSMINFINSVKIE